MRRISETGFCTLLLVLQGERCRNADKGDKRLGVKRQSQGISGQQSTEYPGDGLGEITDHRDTSLVPQVKFFFFISYGCIVEQRRIRSVYQGLPGSQQDLGKEKCRESGGERIT